MNTQTIAIANPPHRPASASLAFTRETYGQWLYRAHRMSASYRQAQQHIAQPAAQARTQTVSEPVVRYFD